MSGPQARAAEVKQIWRNHADPTRLAACDEELIVELCRYPRHVLEEAILKLASDQLQKAEGPRDWVGVVRVDGEEWLAERMEFEATRAARLAANPTLCPRCGRPVVEAICSCGRHAPWAIAPTQPARQGFGQLESAFTSDWEALPERRFAAPLPPKKSARKNDARSARAGRQSRVAKSLADVEDGEWFTVPRAPRGRPERSRKKRQPTREPSD